MTVPASRSFYYILPECMITVHGSLKSEGVKLSIVLAVSQNSRAGHKNGVTKSVHCLAFATDFVQKKAFGRMPRHGVFGCGCIASRRLEPFLTDSASSFSRVA